MRTTGRNNSVKTRRTVGSALEDFTAVLNFINDAAFIHEYGRDGLPKQFIYVNDAACLLTEYSRDELMTMPLADITASHGADDFISFRREFLKTGKLSKHVLVATKSGRKFPAEINAYWTDMGSRKVCFTVVRDMTGQIESRAKLREAEDTYRIHFEHTNDVIISMDPNFRITAVSPSVEKHLGYSPDEFIGKHLQECLHVFQPASIDSAVHNISRLLSGEKLPANVYGFLTREGKEVFAEIQGTPLIHNGDIIGLVSIIRNITDRMKIEEALIESESRYRHLMNQVPVGIVEVDVVNDRFIDVNDIICSYTEYSKEELLNMNVTSLFTEESLTIMQQRIRAFGKGEPLPAEIEYKLRTKSGATLWILCHMRHVIDKGILSRSTGIVYDINERKRIEEKVAVRLRELENNFEIKMHELKALNLDLIASKGDLDRIRSEYESVRQQVVENRSALATLAKNMEHIYYETEHQILMDLRKVLLPVVERMKNDRHAGAYRNELDFLAEYFDLKTSRHAENVKIIRLLTPAELQIASRIEHGMSSEEIAAYLNISVNTVKTHRKNIRKKLGLQDSKIHLVSYLRSHLQQ